MFLGEGLELACMASVHISLARVQLHRPKLSTREPGKYFCSGKGNSMVKSSLIFREHITEGPSE